ncbi:Coenzyme F420-dependent N5,N10-methylene tetrahydromethanopterin reductase-related flavin- dependent oxidoreductase [Gordonia sp. KTR9]|nr:Coenzyme F420-dependent N5,N10-methylene tetrahydromethanopterin reductase-related flavin- dependent oxidoreductase [Gordonia sp. KTR9]
MQIVQALWGSWGYEAGEPDQSGVFADSAHVKAVNLQGQHVGSRGPLPIPPSEQGQPVIFQAGGSGYGLQVAGMYADVVVGMPLTIEDSRAQREMTRRAAVEAGRDADDVKFVAFASFSLGESVREALDRRRALDDKVDASERVALLGALLGLDLDPTRSDDPLTSRQLSAARPHPMDPRSSDALDLAKNGWSPRDMIARGLVDPYPGSVGTAADAADLLQEWFEAGAVDGFIVTVDSLHDGLAPFVDDVVPVLRDRGLFPAEARPTMRENLGLPALYGLDSRLARHKG